MHIIHIAKVTIAHHTSEHSQGVSNFVGGGSGAWLRLHLMHMLPDATQKHFRCTGPATHCSSKPQCRATLVQNSPAKASRGQESLGELVAVLRGASMSFMLGGILITIIE